MTTAKTSSPFDSGGVSSTGCDSTGTKSSATASDSTDGVSVTESLGTIVDEDNGLWYEGEVKLREEYE